MSRYLNAETLPSLSAEDIAEYPLPWDSSILVRVRSLPFSRMKQYTEAQEKGGSYARNQQYQLIQESIIDEHDNEVFSVDAAKQMGKTRTRLFHALIKMIAAHNGSNDEVAAVEKNSGGTDTSGSSSDFA